MWLSRWVYLLRRLGLMLGAYGLLRVLFLLHNRPLLADAAGGQVARAFLHGLRFDLAAVAIVNGLFILLSLLPRRFPASVGYERLVRGVFLASNFPFLVLNLIDLEYVQFNGRRFTVALLRMANDAGVNWTTMVLYYWPITLLSLAFLAALYRWYGRPAASSEGAPMGWGSWALQLAAAVALAIVAIRGGLQFRPLAPQQAMVMNHAGLAQLTLNSTFTLIRSHEGSKLPRHRWFPDHAALMQYLRPFTEGEPLRPAQTNRDNVVILIVESLAAEYCGACNDGPRYTPFLDRLAAQSLFFPRHYANGRRSIEAMPAVLAGLPSLMAESLLESPYYDTHLLGLGTLLERQGYTSTFFHGAEKGTMRFDVLMRQAGIQHYVGLKEYPHPADYDGDWGIYDEPFLQFVAAQLSRQTPPFAAVVFTLSSHHPYPIPAQHRGRFKQGTLPIHESIGYVDYALEQFFATARQQPWYTNTLFLITGDHTQKLETPAYANPLGQYRVPLWCYHPRRQWADVVTNQTTQHVDILPSVLDYLGLAPRERMLFGRSFFRRGEGRAFLHDNGRYWLVRGERALQWTPGQPGQLFAPATDPQFHAPLNEPEPRAAFEREAQALLQYFNNGMLDRELYDRGETLSAKPAP